MAGADYMSRQPSGRAAPISSYDHNLSFAVQSLVLNNAFRSSHWLALHCHWLTDADVIFVHYAFASLQRSAPVLSSLSAQHTRLFLSF